MKIRTIYFKTAQMKPAVAFWQGFLGQKPHKTGKEWVEFRVGELNFALLMMPGFTLDADQANGAPVFELPIDEVEAAKAKALELGARIVVDIKEHPDKMSYVLADPQGNEFEITRMRD